MAIANAIMPPTPPHERDSTGTAINATTGDSRLVMMRNMNVTTIAKPSKVSIGSSPFQFFDAMRAQAGVEYPYTRSDSLTQLVTHRCSKNMAARKITYLSRSRTFQ
jgi:hypothetical protein